MRASRFILAPALWGGGRLRRGLGGRGPDRDDHRVQWRPGGGRVRLLSDFIAEVNAQTGKKISTAQAASFIAQAQDVEAALC